MVDNSWCASRVHNFFVCFDQMFVGEVPLIVTGKEVTFFIFGFDVFRQLQHGMFKDTIHTLELSSDVVAWTVWSSSGTVPNAWYHGFI